MPKRILGPELNSCFPGKKLWHLFSWEERYKLETFLDGALWCSDVGSIIGFDGDAEGSRFYGIFISCWHVNVGDPSENVWDVFGGGGNGFAIRTSTERLKAIADATRTEYLMASCREVSYISPKKMLVDPAFQVRKSHINEEEFRLALKINEQQQQDEGVLKDKVRKIAASHCVGRAYDRPIRRLTLSERDTGDFFQSIPIVFLRNSWSERMSLQLIARRRSTNSKQREYVAKFAICQIPKL
jgi:hypothetical protein